MLRQDTSQASDPSVSPAGRLSNNPVTKGSPDSLMVTTDLAPLVCDKRRHSGGRVQLVFIVDLLWESISSSSFSEKNRPRITTSDRGRAPSRPPNSPLSWDVMKARNRSNSRRSEFSPGLYGAGSCISSDYGCSIETSIPGLRSLGLRWWLGTKKRPKRERRARVGSDI